MTSPTTTALMPYADREDVKALSTRIMAVHPAAKQIGERGALLLAQLGLALGLNPLPGTGHVHAWIDKDGQLCVHVGLEGRLALARAEARFSLSTRPMSGEEATLHGIKPGDVGAVCELYRHDLTEDQKRLGIPLTPFVGVGLAQGNERVPRGRTLYWRAQQRAIKDALRLAFGFTLPAAFSAQVRVVEEEQGEVIDIDTVEESSDSSTPAVSKTEQATADINVRTAARPYSPDVLRQRLAQFTERNEGREPGARTRGVMVSLLDTMCGNDVERRHALTLALFSVTSSKNLTGAQVLAALDWIGADRDEDDKLRPSYLAMQEAAAVLAAEHSQGEIKHETEPVPAG